MDLEVLGASFTSDALAKSYFFAEVINWDADIAAAGNSSKSTRNDNDGAFVIDSLAFSAWIPAASGGALAFSPFVAEASPTVGNNTFPALSSLTLELSLNGRSWFRSPIRTSLLCGDGKNALYLAQKAIIPPGGTLVGNLTNGSTFTARAQLVLLGRKVPV